jgi:phospholipid transport system substrate-binding protein
MLGFQTMSKKVILSVALLLSAMVVNADEWKEASQVVEKSTETMLELIKQSRLEAAQKSEELGQAVPLDEPKIILAIDLVLDPVIDFGSIAKGVMARFYRSASSQQIEDFRVALKRSLLNTYARTFLSLKIDSFEIQDTIILIDKPGRQKILVKVYANSSVYDLNYSMKKRQKVWRVTNVTIDGINLGLAFRKQFANAMAQNKGQMDDVISSWNDPF